MMLVLGKWEFLLNANDPSGMSDAIFVWSWPCFGFKMDHQIEARNTNDYRFHLANGKRCFSSIQTSRCICSRAQYVHFLSTSVSLHYSIGGRLACVCLFLFYYILNNVHYLFNCVLHCNLPATEVKTMSVNFALFRLHTIEMVVRSKENCVFVVASALHPMCMFGGSTPSSLDQQREKQTINRISIRSTANNTQ